MEAISVPMTLTKTTKGTYVYSANVQDAAVTTVYVSKHAFNGTPPSDITLVLKD